MNDNYTDSRKKAAAKKSNEMLINLGLVACAVVAMLLLALTKTILYFGPNNPNIFRGIFSIPIYGLSIIGTVLSYLVKRGKPSIEMFLNAGVFVATLWFF